MTVIELYELLKSLPSEAKVVVYDNEWGLYDEVLSAKVRTADVSAYLNDHTATNLYPKGDTPVRYSRKVSSITVVEIISDGGRLK